jgi:hypothetical protein
MPASAFEIAFLLARRPRLTSAAAFFLVASEVFPLAGGGSFTPSRRALERPIAIACFVERTRCLPRRTCSISSRTNSPACVDGAFPCRLALRALLTVCFSGIMHPQTIELYQINFYAVAAREIGPRVKNLSVVATCLVFMATTDRSLFLSHPDLRSP